MNTTRQENQMTTDDLARYLAEMIWEADDSGDFTEPVITQSYAEAGVLTSDAGLVISIGDAEFQVTVVRSR